MTTARKFLSDFINAINLFLIRTLERIDGLYWKQKKTNNYLASEYTLDECIRMALDPSEAELELLLKVYDMKNPIKYQQIKIDEAIEKNIEEERKNLGKNVIKNYNGSRKKGKK